VIFGVFALGAYLANGRAGRMGLMAMVITVVGHALFLVIGGVSAFAAAAEGQAYLAGIEEEFARLDYGIAHAATFGLIILLGFLVKSAVVRAGRISPGPS
jgi:hypothetical protein